MTDLFDLATRLTVDTSAHDAKLAASRAPVKALESDHKALQAQLDIGKMRTASMSAEIDKFTNALHNNSANVRKSADDFLGLFSKVTGHASATHEAEAGTKKLSEAFQLLSSSVVVADGPLGGVASRIRALSSETTELGGLLGPGGIIIGGILAIGAGLVVISDGLFKLAEHTADYAEKMGKAALTTGLSQRALAGLKVISEETNSNLDALTTTAARLQTAISRGISEPAGEAGRALKFLGLQNEEFKHSSPEKQLQEVAKRLGEVTSQADKNRASQELMNRGWIESAESIHRIAEGFEEAQQKADAFGLVMTDRDIAAAEEFNKSIHDLWLLFEGFGLAVGRQILPQVEGVIQDLTTAIFGVDAALGGNQSAWEAWGDFATKTIMTVRVEAAGLMALMNDAAGLSWVNPWTAMQQKADQVTNQYLNAQERTGGSLTGGAGLFRQSAYPSAARGGAKGGGSSSDPFTDFLEKQKTEIAEATSNADQYQKEIDRLVSSLQKQGKALTDTQMALLQVNATTLRGIEVDKQATESRKRSIEFTFQWTQQISEARGTSDQYDAAINKLIEGLKGYTVAEYAATRAALEKNAVILRTLAQTRERIALEQTLIDRLERERYVTQENWSRNFGVDMTGGDATRKRRVFGPSDEELNAEREKLRAFANDVMGLFDRAVSDAFAGSWKRAFADVLLGFLDMMKKMEMELLAGKLAKALESSMGGGSGGGLGGFLKLLLGIGAAGLGAGMGSVGSHGAAIPHAGTGGIGGPLPHFASGISRVPYDMLAVIHKDEAVIPASQNMGGGGHTFVFNITSPNPQSFMSWETQSQITSRMRSALQKSSRN